MVIRMELFDNNKQQGVRLRSHLDKYLVADDDQQSTRQSRNGKARRARWVVELVDRKPGFIRLKSCYGHYLSASNHPFLLGFTGKRVVQSQPESITDLKIEWRPIRDGFQVKLVAYDGSYLRANGGTPPWRNTITHDVPQASTSTKNWILWEVEAVEVPENENLTDYLSLVTSFSSVTDELSSLDLGSPMSTHSGFGSPRLLTTKSSLPEPEVKKITAMEVFRNAKAVRLQSVQNKYLIAEDDEVSVSQSRNGSSKSAKWTVELVENTDDINIIRLKSCYNKYLTASNQAFLLGMTGKKVLQTIPNRVDSSVEWEPVKEGNRIKLKTRYGHFLRANGGLKPWKNSVTHDIPHRTATQDWVLWEVHVVEFVAQSPAAAAVSNEPVVQHSGSFTSETSTPSSLSSKSASFSGLEFGDSMVDSAAQHKVPPGEGNGNGNGNGNGRRIYYQMADEYGEVEEEEEGERCSITFKGNSVEELTKKLEVETGLDDIQVCTRSPLNGKLYPLRLHLPPNNAPFNVVIFQSSPKVARAMPVISLPRNI